jgi:hypothetical protein
MSASKQRAKEAQNRAKKVATLAAARSPPFVRPPVAPPEPEKSLSDDKDSILTSVMTKLDLVMVQMTLFTQENTTVASELANIGTQFIKLDDKADDNTAAIKLLNLRFAVAGGAFDESSQEKIEETKKFLTPTLKNKPHPPVNFLHSSK